MRIIQIILFCGLFMGGSAQGPHLLFNKFTTTTGLASNEVFSVWQDKKGFIWIGSTNGLQRFDGKRFMSFSALNDERFASQSINQIAGDGSGNMWVKTGREYGLYDPAAHTFHKPVIMSGHTLTGDNQLVTDEEGNIFILYFRNTILKYDKKADRFTDDVPFIIPGGWRPTSFFYNKYGNEYWIGCDSGLAIYNTVKRDLQYYRNNPGQNPLLDVTRFSGIRTIHIDKAKRCWISYWPGTNPVARYACYDEAEKRFTTDTAGLYYASKGYYDIRGTFETSRGDVWMFGEDVLLSYNSLQKRFINNKGNGLIESGIKLNTTHTMYEDREHNVWVATDAGLYTISPEMPGINNYILSTANGENNITGLSEINGRLWVSSWEKGIIIFDSSFKRINTDKLYKNNFKESRNAPRLAWDLQQSVITGKVWIACQYGWLQVVDPQDFSYDLINPPVFSNSTVRQVAEDKAGNLWFGTQGGRIIKYDPHHNYDSSFFRPMQQFNGAITKIFTDNANRLWIGTGEDGLYCIDTRDGHIIYHYTTKGEKNRTLFDDNVTDISQVNDSIYVIAATTFHLLNTRTGIIRKYSYADAIASNRITGLLADASSNIWTGTSNGVCRYNFTTDNFTSYSEKDGFDDFETVGQVSLLFKDKRVALAGRNQVSVFNPGDFNKRMPSPRVIITDVKLFNTFLPVDSLLSLKTIRFNHDQNSLTFYFSSLNFLQNDKMKYFYRLDRSGQEWQQADNSMSVNYTLLPSGTYRFQVRCENEQGMNAPVTEMNFIIRPPFYKTWWFILLIAVLVAAEAWLFYRIKRNRREAVERMRTQVARDLHDDMGSTLSTINILSAMAENKLPSDTSKAQEYISKIRDNSQRMMEAMDDIVWSIKPSNDSMQKIAGRMREFSTSVLEAKDIDLQFRIDDDVNSVKLNMAARRDFFLIFKEAINNVAKYSKARQVFVQVSCHANRLVLMVKDNGTGFDADKADSGNGLNNMQKRADNLKARLQIQSKPGVGTQVILNMLVK